MTIHRRRGRWTKNLIIHWPSRNALWHSGIRRLPLGCCCMPVWAAFSPPDLTQLAYGSPNWSRLQATIHRQRMITSCSYVALRAGDWEQRTPFGAMADDDYYNAGKQ